MKNFLAVLALVSSFGAFAQTTEKLKITNVTYPEQVMTFTCVDEACATMTFVLKKDDKTDYRIIETARIEAAMNRTETRSRHNELDYEAFDGVKEVSATVKKKMNEGYIFEALGNSLLFILAVPFDAVMIPADFVTDLTNKKNEDSRMVSRAMKRLDRNLDSDLKEIKLKHKYFAQINAASTILSRPDVDRILAESNPIILKYAKNPMESNCALKINLPYLQLYVKGEFRGNYPLEGDQEVLTKKLQEMDATGFCSEK